MAAAIAMPSPVVATWSEVRKAITPVVCVLSRIDTTSITVKITAAIRPHMMRWRRGVAVTVVVAGLLTRPSVPLAESRP
ncbi:hypothetical protein GCM10011381_31710 [Klenkia taihuensis]|nr:hypothetical protein GCM10011381_31710 [Klenkia taihuensis]